MRKPDASLIHISNLKLKLKLILRPLCPSHLLLSPRKLRRIDVLICVVLPLSHSSFSSRCSVSSVGRRAWVCAGTWCVPFVDGFRDGDKFR